MAVELMSYNREQNSSLESRIEEIAAKEAAKAGFQSVEMLVRMLSSQPSKTPPKFNGQIDCRAVADVAVSKFRKFISVLDGTRTGHARFRRGPVQKPVPEPVRILPPPNKNVSLDTKELGKTISFGGTVTATATTTASFVSSVTAGDSESCQRSMSSSGFQITNMSLSVSRPPLSGKRKCGSGDGGATAKCGSSSGRCHCSKKRKSRVKRVVRIPAISSKLADIPPDDFSWRKYGQKPIKGSPHPRGYYKCSTMRSCPARKHVERALDDPNMLIVTYEGEHSHSQAATKALSPVVFESS